MKPFPNAMSAKQELALARRLVELRHNAWRALLDYPPFAEAMCDRLDADMEADERPQAELLGLRQAAAELRARDNRETIAAYGHARDALAQAVSTHRHEAELFRRMASEVKLIGRDRSAAKTRHARVLEVRSPPRGSKVFRGYVSRLRRVDVALTAARQQFVANNLRLVVSIARRYNHAFLTQADLIQEGTLGLLRAVDGYDPDRGTRFSTYAAWWIKHGITRALANYGLTVRVPANVLGLRAQLSRAEQSFVSEHGRSPTDKELALSLALPVKTVANARRAVLGRAELPDEGENLPDEFAVDVDGMIDKPVVETELRDLVDDLPGIEGSVIRKRFALEGEPALTLAEIGQEHSLSRERIRQIEKQALRRMRGELQERGIAL